MKKETKRKKKFRTAVKKEELILDSYFMNKKWIDPLHEDDDDFAIIILQYLSRL